MPTRLMAHIYGTKNLYTAIIRLITVYTLPASLEMYCLCWCTFLGVFALYSTEFASYRTVRGREAMIPLITSSLGMAWMWLERGYYCRDL
jgi:VanZ family protein